jgi:protein tyrosine phosphatase (PTP) superfamily phosphohydrolase (DUF442 family)
MISRCRCVAILLLLVGASLLAQGTPAGVNNFQQVNQHLYRGAQPSDAGFANLAKLGVKTVIDLREPGARASHESEVVGSLGMRYANIPLQGYSAPSPAQLTKVMAILDDSAAAPVFVHCRRGADRTGTIIAVYRITHDHWANQRALAEAKKMKMAVWEFEMKNFVLQYHPPGTAEQTVSESRSQPNHPTID